MNDAMSIREPSIIREEIEDLENYLLGIPEQLRLNGGFTGYEHRLEELNNELILSRLSSISPNLLNLTRVSPGEKTAASAAPDDIPRKIDEDLKQIEMRHKRLARHYAWSSRFLQYALLVTTAGSVFGVLTPVMVIAIVLTTVSTFLALTLLFLKIFDRAKKEERLADYFMTLRSEAANFFTLNGAGDLSKYKENSAKMIQDLIERINKVEHQISTSKS